MLLVLMSRIVKLWSHLMYLICVHSSFRLGVKDIMFIIMIWDLSFYSQLKVIVLFVRILAAQPESMAGSTVWALTLTYPHTLSE